MPVNNAWQAFIENRHEKIGQAVSEDLQYKRKSIEFNMAIESLQARAKTLTDMEMLDRLRDLNDELTGIVEEKFYLAGLKDGVALGQMLLISEAGNDGNDYLENCLDEHMNLAAEIGREYSEREEGEGLKAS